MANPPNYQSLLNDELSVSFRNDLRASRAKARSDGENFIGLVHVFERLGAFLHGNPAKARGLGSYKQQLRGLCKSADERSSFDELFPLVQNGRNSAVHQGHVARHLVRHATRLALLLEGNLMAEREEVRHFMVEDPVRTYPWQLVAHARHVMLENAFSFLPMQKLEGGPWYWLSDDALLAYLRGRGVDDEERRKRLNRKIEESFKEIEHLLGEAFVVGPRTAISDLVARLPEHVGRPALVVDDDQAGRLLGIITAEDLL